MSVHVRLNNRSFFGGNSVIIGSRLNEAEESQNAGQQQLQLPQQLQLQNQGQQNLGQQNQLQLAQGQNQQLGQQLQQNQNQPTLDQLVNGIIINGFVNMTLAVALEFQKIQLPLGFQWQAPGQMQEQTVNGAIQMAQAFLKANIEVAKKAIESAQQNAQGQSNTENNNLNNNQQAQ